ncbi:hypothetical protein [Psychroserpens sp.]|uniref:hypothetical protein n=1 Tax=Psychroserpens sp. TaxID=2020870 RepID=UPI002B270DB2|nr:hypothetical protein [Psychroserpens sp.]
MNIKFNESENSIEIKDRLKIQYLIFNLMFISNMANSIIRLLDRNKTEFGMYEYFLFVMGIGSLFGLYYLIFKKSTAEKINLEEIEGLKELSILGKKSFTLELNNGKSRDLGRFNNESELKNFCGLLNKVGIATK